MNDSSNLYSQITLSYIDAENNFLETIKSDFLEAIKFDNIDQFKKLTNTHFRYFLSEMPLGFYLSDLCKYIIDILCESKKDNYSIVLYEKLISEENFNWQFLNYFPKKCIEMEYYEMLHYLINNRQWEKNDHMVNMISSCIECDFEKIFSCEYEFNKKFSLLLAIKKNKMDFIKMYIDDVDINFDDGRLLECAVSHNNIDASKFLINCGASINNKKNSILFHALMNHNIEMVQLLIETGIDLQESFGTTYSTLTSSNQCEFNSQKTKPIIKLLADSGANMEDFANMLYIKLFPEAGRQTYYSY